MVINKLTEGSGVYPVPSQTVPTGGLSASAYQVAAVHALSHVQPKIIQRAASQQLMDRMKLSITLHPRGQFQGCVCCKEGSYGYSTQRAWHDTSSKDSGATTKHNSSSRQYRRNRDASLRKLRYSLRKLCWRSP